MAIADPEAPLTIAEPAPDAPLDPRALPAYWHARRRAQGKPDSSRCAAELERALKHERTQLAPDATERLCAEVELLDAALAPGEGVARFKSLAYDLARACRALVRELAELKLVHERIGDILGEWHAGHELSNLDALMRIGDAWHLPAPTERKEPGR